MKRILPMLAAACLMAGAAQAQTEKTPAKAHVKEPYDSLYAKKLGVTSPMHRYVVAFLKAGPTPSKDKEEQIRLQKAHMANIGRMAHEGQLVVAGPFMDNGELRGIYIFNVETVEAAKKLTETDPLIQSGGLVMELHPWFGSSAMLDLPRLHEKLTKDEAKK